MVAVQLPLVTTGSTTAAGGTGDIRTIRDGWEKRAWVRRSRPFIPRPPSLHAATKSFGASELRRTNFPQRNAEENLVELNGIEPSAS